MAALASWVTAKFAVLDAGALRLAKRLIHAHLCRAEASGASAIPPSVAERSAESLVFFLPEHPGIVQAVGQVYGCGRAPGTNEFQGCNG